MALRNILTDGDPLLRKVSREINEIDERTRILIDDMFETMYANNGIGLAAVQVGVLRRLFVMDLRDESGPFVLINPRIEKTSGKQTGQEGCLSVPGVSGEVERPEKLTVTALDRDGKPFTLEAEDLMAVCISHEYDHLNGVLFTDKAVGELIET